MTVAAAAAEAAQGSGRVYCATVVNPSPKPTPPPPPPPALAALDYWKPESSARPEQTAWALAEREKSTETTEVCGSRPPFSLFFLFWAEIAERPH